MGEDHQTVLFLSMTFISSLLQGGKKYFFEALNSNLRPFVETEKENMKKSEILWL